MNFALMWQSLPDILNGALLTIELILPALAAGIVLATAIALVRLYGGRVARRAASTYVFIFRGTPLLVQIALIYYGLSQFQAVRDSIFWVVLREPYWCAVIAFSLNTAAYTSEIIRGGILSVPHGQIEAARACGMSRVLLYRRIIGPLTVRLALPAYGNEVILTIKATSLASTITLMEITGVAHRIIAETFQPVAVFLVAGAVYLAMNFTVTRIIKRVEWAVTPDLRARA